MRILLIKPPLNKNLLAPNNDEPLELEYVAAAVGGHEVDILDMRIEKNLWKKLGNFRPDLVGITAYTCDVRVAKKVLQEVKKFSGSIKTVVGGHHATVLPIDFALPFVDAIFLGIADHSFGQYVGLREFYRQYAGLYSKSYSFRRYFRWKLRYLVDLWRKTKRFAPPASDRIPFFQLAFLRAFALHMHRKVRKRYKVEPLV